MVMERRSYDRPMQEYPRLLTLSGATNFRDLGGYQGHEGRPVRWRCLFRSDHLGNLSAADIASLEAIGINRVLDFRGKLERETLECALPSAKVYSLAIEPTVVQGMKTMMEAGEVLTPEHTVRLMKQTYSDFVEHNSPRFAELFRHLLEADSPLVFHCTAGKDRTGFAAALILHALGVSHEDIQQDYLLTNAHFRMPAQAAVPLSDDVLRILWRVQEGFLRSAFETVDARFGGVSEYLRSELGVSDSQQQHLRDRYLQKQ